MNRWLYARLVVGIIAISFSPLAVKIVTFSSTVSAFYRSFYAAIFFLIMSLFNYRTEFGAEHLRWLLLRYSGRAEARLGFEE